MGLFTSIEHPITKEELQIKTDNDICSYLKVGDETDISDGVYTAHGGDENNSVIILDGIISKVILTKDYNRQFKFWLKMMIEKD